MAGWHEPRRRERRYDHLTPVRNPRPLAPCYACRLLILLTVAAFLTAILLAFGPQA